MEINKNMTGWALGLVAIGGAAYAALLGWDRQRDFDSATSTYSGPYQAWQVILLAVIIGGAAFLAGRAGHVLLAAVTLTLTVTAAFALVAVTDAASDGLWVVGALAVLVGAGVGVTLAALVGRATATKRP